MLLLVNAGYPVTRLDGGKSLPGARTDVHNIGAARTESAAARWIGWARQVRAQHDAGLLTPRYCRKKRLGVGVARVRPQALPRCPLHDLAQVHHRDGVGEMLDHRQVVEMNTNASPRSR